jgi:hypothetical protein
MVQRLPATRVSFARFEHFSLPPWRRGRERVGCPYGVRATCANGTCCIDYARASTVTGSQSAAPFIARSSALGHAQCRASGEPLAGRRTESHAELDSATADEDLWLSG